jgi:transposase
MHELKEKIRKNFNKTNDWYAGGLKLGMWLSRAKKYFPNSNNTIIRWYDEVIALLLTLIMVQIVVWLRELIISLN